MKIVRFIADPTGYIVHKDDEHLETGWVRATPGFYPEEVKINLDLAYVVELRDS
jgi:hypothetical protein